MNKRQDHPPIATGALLSPFSPSVTVFEVGNKLALHANMRTTQHATPEETC